MEFLHRHRHFLLPAGMIACLLVLLMPLPAALMDTLLVANITVSILILLTSFFVRSPIEFSVFPSLLLATTMSRLVLNVATTRLILSRAHVDGLDAAGTVVRQFGQFVSGDQVVIGAVIFAIIVVIQFVVITKGATRIGEVAARFTLDGLPGKQMAIDAELSAGLIDHAQAKLRHEEIERQADFYGAMDGASKFVQGDAVAGVIITCVNIVGGLILGIIQGGMAPTEAVDLYSRLTIGDGLVSQVPAFLISLATGLLITRSASKTNLPEQMIDQLILRPEVLAVTAAFLVLLTLTRLPMVPLLALAAVCGVIAWRGLAEPEVDVDDQQKQTPPDVQAKVEKRVEDFLHVDPLELEIGVGLLRLADPRRGGDLLERISNLRQRVAGDLGIVLPKVRIRDNLRLDDHDYRIKIANTPVATGTCLTNRMLAADPGNVSGAVEGVPCRIAAMGHRATWVDGMAVMEAETLGYRLYEPADALLEHLRIVVYQFADELLGRDATQHLIDELAATQPALVKELIPNTLRLGTVQQVLQELLRQGISIRSLSTILETLCDQAAESREVSELVRQVRHRLGRGLSLGLRDSKGLLAVVTMDTSTHTVLRSLQQRSPGVGIDSDTFESLSDRLSEACGELRSRSRPEVILAPGDLCGFVRRLIVERLPFAHVLAMNEISADTRIEIVQEIAVPTELEHAA